MADRLNIINSYYSTLNKVGYINDKTLLNLIVYLALQEILDSWTFSEEQYKVIVNILEDIKNKECIIKMNTPCINTNKGILQNNNYYNFSFCDVPQQSNDNVFLKELWQIISEHNLFAVQ